MGDPKKTEDSVAADLEGRLVRKLKAWLRSSAERIVSAGLDAADHASIAFHASNGGEDEDGTVCLDVRVEESISTDVEGGRVEGVMST